MNWKRLADHLILWLGLVFLVLPVISIFVSATHSTGILRTEGIQLYPGLQPMENFTRIFTAQAGFVSDITTISMLKNSSAIALGVGAFSCAFSLMAAYSLVYFRSRLLATLFPVIFITILLPLEARFVPTFQVVSDLGLINTHAGMILPALTAALGTFFFRQHLLTIPDELLEAAKMDGAGHLRFFVDIVMPLSLRPVFVLFVVAFMVGWNQYLWPIIIATDESMYTLVRGVQFFGQLSGPGMALLTITMLPPFLLFVACQRWIIGAIRIRW